MRGQHLLVPAGQARPVCDAGSVTAADSFSTSAAGFTLLEVLIALAVIGVAVLALGQTGTNAPAHYLELRHNTEALWVARNVITDLRIETPFPATGVRTGSERMGGTEWRWQAEIGPTPDADIRRVDVVVFSRSLDEPVIRHSGFFGRR